MFYILIVKDFLRLQTQHAIHTDLHVTYIDFELLSE